MAIVLASTPDEATADHQIYDKVQMAKDDATKILSEGSSSFMEVSNNVMFVIRKQYKFIEWSRTPNHFLLFITESILMYFTH